jgi:pentatricopeptide repeat protein
LPPTCAVGAGVKPPHVAAGRQIGRIKSIKREKLKAQETIVLEVTPESPGADYLWLKVWVRQRDFRILKTAIREKRFITEIIPQSWQKLPNGVAFPYELLILPLCPNRVPAADYRKVVFSEVKLNVGISDDAFALPANAYVLPADAYVWENLSSEKYLEKLQASPNSPELYYFLGRSYLNEHLTLLSIDAFKKAIELKPQMKVAYYRLIDAYRRAKQYDDAVKVYERLIKVDPESASQHYVGIASIYGEQGNDEKKMEMAKKAIETKPDDAEAHNLLARIYRYSKQYLSAVADTKKAIELESLPFPRYRYKIQLGEIYHEMGENDLAAATLEEAFKNAPEQLAREMAIHPLLETLKEVGRLDEAIARYEAELKVQPDRIELYKIVGRAYALKGDYKRAAKIYQQAIKADIHGSYDVDLYEALARTYEQTREFKKARCVYEELIKLYPESEGVKEWRESIDFLHGKK